MSRKSTSPYVPSTPSSDTQARIAASKEAKILTHTLVPFKHARGRGAQSNDSGRFERLSTHDFDDGWGHDDGLETVKTTVKTTIKTHVRDEKAKSIVSKNQSPDIPFERSINPYRGCEHGCAYCFARPTHAYLGHSAGLDFERELYAKINAAQKLREELGRKNYRVRPIAMGTNTDPYQPIERTYKIMRQILQVFLETKHPLTIVTKSALIVRDLDILAALAEHNLVRVAFSLTSLAPILSRQLEPRAPTPKKRLEAMQLLSQAHIPTFAMFAPVIPALNDMELEKILEAAAAHGAQGAAMIMLRLPGEVQDIFREWLLRYYPDKLRHVMNLTRNMRSGAANDPRFGHRMRGHGPYAQALHRRYELACARNGLNKRPKPLNCKLFVPPKKTQAQLSLFE